MKSSNVTAKFGYGSQLLSLVLLPIRRLRERNWVHRQTIIWLSTRYGKTSIKSQMDNLFISALIRAGTCNHHLPGEQFKTALPSPPSLRLKSRRRWLSAPIGYIRAFHECSNRTQLSLAVQTPTPSQDDYKHLIDYYRDSFDTERFDLGRSVEEPLDEDFIFRGSVEVHTTHIEKALDDAGHRAVEDVVKTVMDTKTSREELFQSYQNLPSPGVYHLPQHVRQTLLLRLSIVKRKNEMAMLRYLSVVDDMRAASLPLSVAEWSSAIYLAGRSFQKVTTANVESAIRIWKEMENEAGVKSNNVTFNILFHIATRACKFSLAQMILEEMKLRKLRMDRYAQSGLIYYYGLRRDGDGVRRAYHAFVESGQIVTIDVLNCVIASLIRAGELPAAVQVFERMKNKYAGDTRAKPPPKDFMEHRDLKKMLNQAGRDDLTLSEGRKQLQAEQALAPNFETYLMFLKHHVSYTGELQQIMPLLDEMQSYGVPVNGRVFVELFRGFTLHGGIRYTSWTEVRLESAWNSFIKAVRTDGGDDVFVGKQIVHWILKAFVKCSRRGRALEIWDELKSRWKPTELEMERIQVILANDRNKVALSLSGLPLL